MKGLLHVRTESAQVLQWVSKATSIPSNRLQFQVQHHTLGGSMLKHWEADRAKWGEKPYEVSIVTEPSAVPEVAYALFTKQIPVLVSAQVREAAKQQLGETVLSHPLFVAANASEAEANFEQSILDFVVYPQQGGRIFVIEGGDGAGKQTQVALLCKRLEQEGFVAKTLDYPHDAARYGALIRDLLSGAMGNIKEVNPLIFAALYGLNRHDTLPFLQYWLLRGHNVVLDRYMSANWGHQASKYATDAERIAAIDTLAKFELNWLKLPPAHRVIYLNLPPEWALKAMKADSTREALDMHELAGLDYKNKVRDSFLWCCKQFPGWAEVKCLDDKESRYSREELSDQIFDMLKTEFVAPAPKSQ